MIFFVIILCAVNLVCIAALYRSVKRNFELIEVIENTNEKIDSSIEELDYLYKKFEKKSKLELFSDEPAVRELVEDIKQTKKVVFEISTSLTGEDIQETDKN